MMCAAGAIPPRFRATCRFAKAYTLRGPGAGQALDGPFAETKEQLLGLYVLHVKSEDEAIDTARQLRRTNPSAVYESRPILH
jgi:hypothetical protein